MVKKTQLEAIVDIRKKLNEAVAPKGQKVQPQLLVRDLVDALIAAASSKHRGGSTGNFNFDDYVGRKNPDDYDGSGTDIYYWHLKVKGVKWTFATSEEADIDNIPDEIKQQNLPEDYLNSPISDSYDVLDHNGTISEPGWLSERQIWKKIWE